MNRLCVFCGAQVGARDDYAQAAQALGVAIAARSITLVYGGGKIGLMGIIADAVLDRGGTVIGVIPSFLSAKDIVHAQLTECYVTDNLFDRKTRMFELADAFIALPGGLGTLDELIEVITWQQLRQLDKPVGILNTAEYFAPLLATLQHAVTEGFTAQTHIDKLRIAEDPQTLLDQLTPTETAS